MDSGEEVFDIGEQHACVFRDVSGLMLSFLQDHSSSGKGVVAVRKGFVYHPECMHCVQERTVKARLNFPNPTLKEKRTQATMHNKRMTKFTEELFSVRGAQEVHRLWG